jgi:membrane associated rhomboid family serine protease
MLPIGDEWGSRTGRSYVTWGLVAAMVLVSAYQTRLPPNAAESLVASYGLVPARLFGDPGHYWPTLLTHVFLHGGLAHLAGNMVFLVVFGRRVESALGRPGFLAFFLLGGMAAGLASALTRFGSDTPGIGASGAISAVLGAYLVLFATARVRILVLHPLTLLWLFMDQSLLTFSVPAFVMVLVWFGLQVVEGLAGGLTGGVDYAAHVGGFLAGFAAIQLVRHSFGLWPDEDGLADEAPPLDVETACVGAARPLEAGHILARSDLQLQQRRAGNLDAEAIAAAKIDAAVGRRLGTPHIRYEAIRWSDLTERSEGHALPEQ